MTSVLAGFVLGVAGSGHCIGMCGPLVLTLGRSLARPSRGAQLRHAAIYHGGRILTYVALAVPAGLAGQALALGGFGRALAILSGAILLAFAAGSIWPRFLGRFGAGASAAAARACVAANTWSRRHPVAGPGVSGAANGLVPCGLVYAALTAATATGTRADALAVMMGFGLGTLPALMALSLAAVSFPPALRMRLRHLTPVVLALVAALLLIRGLGLHVTTSHHPPISTSPSHH